MTAKLGVALFVIYTFIGLYFMNFFFKWLIVPDFFTPFEPWIFALGGIMVLVAGIKFLFMGGRYRNERR
jgi:hypothetical protein